MNDDRFVGKGNELTFPICFNCIHYEGGKKCKAFSEIPIAILSGGKHDGKYPGQKGEFVFKKRGEK